MSEYIWGSVKPKKSEILLPKEFVNKHYYGLWFSTRTLKLLMYSGLLHLRDLMDTTESDMLKRKNLGKKVVAEIKSELGKVGLTLIPEMEKPTKEAITLEKIKKVAMAHFTKEFIDDLDLDIAGHFSFDTDNYLFRAVKELLAFKAGDRIVRHPENWKEAFKERWFPAWLKKRYPVKYTEYDVLVVFPDLLKKHPCPEGLRNQNYYINFVKHPFLPPDEGRSNERK